MNATFVVIARFGYRHEAELAKGYLDHAGIYAALFADDAGGAEVGLTFVNSVRLMVARTDVAPALEVLQNAGIRTLEAGDNEATR